MSVTDKLFEASSLALHRTPIPGSVLTVLPHNSAMRALRLLAETLETTEEIDFDLFSRVSSIRSDILTQNNYCSEAQNEEKQALADRINALINEKYFNPCMVRTIKTHQNYTSNNSSLLSENYLRAVYQMRQQAGFNNRTQYYTLRTSSEEGFFTLSFIDSFMQGTLFVSHQRFRVSEGQILCSDTLYTLDQFLSRVPLV